MKFDSRTYWKSRHKHFMSDLRGVGNLNYSLIKNQSIYQKARRHLAKLLRALDVKPGGNFLDVGCGNGQLAKPVIGAGLAYVGVDISPQAVHLGTEKCAAARFYVGDISEMAFAETFDIIFARTVLIHLTEDALWGKALDGIAACMHDNSVFVLWDQMASAPTQLKDAPHVRLRTVGEYTEALKARGLRFDEELLNSMPSSVKLPVIHLITADT